MNSICTSCPRYNPEFVPAPGESWYAAHYCSGSDDHFTGCVRKPYHPHAAVLDLVYNVDKEIWEYRQADKYRPFRPDSVPVR